MSDEPDRVYLDACVLLAYVTDEPDRANVVQSILDDARQARIKLLTSVLSIAEVAYVPSGADSDIALDEDDAIDELWTPASPITLVDISETVARGARQVIRRATQSPGTGVRSADAIHLASAELHSCNWLFTYENEATKTRWNNLIPPEVAEPFTSSPQLGFSA
jgi:predicted nucleic acid-binding protein